MLRFGQYVDTLPEYDRLRVFRAFGGFDRVAQECWCITGYALVHWPDHTKATSRAAPSVDSTLR